jgi:type I restriction enzyme R subunit
MFTEDTVVEKMLIDTISKNGWKHITAEDLTRTAQDVMVESQVKAALIRLNSEIAEQPARADEVIYRLRTLFQSVQAHSLVSMRRHDKKSIIFVQARIQIVRLISR